MTKLTVPITATSEVDIPGRIETAQRLGAEAVEIRLDYLDAPPDYARIVEGSDLPIIWTMRHVTEGGRFDGPDRTRAAELARAIEAGGDYVDVEYRRWRTERVLRDTVSAALEKARSAGRKIKFILSYHNFSETPRDLDRIVREIPAEADVVKFAVAARDVFDNFSVFRAIRVCKRPAVGLAMGGAGQISRVLAKKLGCELMFASIDDASASAPGQLTIAELKEQYNWDHLGSETKVLGVVGDPVEHSLSPQMHNAAYRQMGFDGLYLRFHVLGDYTAFHRFAERLRGSRWLDVLGLSVTIPHKTHALRYLRENDGAIDSLAATIGAVNTITFEPSGRLAGHNTDYLGALRAIELGAGLTPEMLSGRRVVVLGAGGASRAIVAVMRSCDAVVTISNRTAAKGEALADEFACQFCPWEQRDELKADLLINGTSIGMWPDVEGCPIDPSVIGPEMVVFDTVYNPLETTLLASAKQAGALTVDGASMLTYQAAEQIRLWQRAIRQPEATIPVQVMRDVLLKHLASSRSDSDRGEDPNDG